MRSRPQIALLIETSNAYGRGLLEGIAEYSRANGPWTMLLAEHARGDAPPPWLKDWKGDGLIARVENQEVADSVLASGLPAVDVSAARLAKELPIVETSDYEISRMAIEHFLEKGLKQFAFCGNSHFEWSRRRERFFKEILTEKGIEPFSFSDNHESNQADSWDAQQQAIVDWVKTLPQPIGIFACYDHRGRQVIDACREIDIAVPENAAVVAVDNDELICEICDPPMTSIHPDTVKTGYKAAEILDQLMKDPSLDLSGETLIPPTGIITRQSSDMLAIEDRRIAEAVTLIRRHACDGITVAELVERSGWSRRVFESRFKSTLGATPHELLLKNKLDRCCELLAHTQLPLHEIAPRAGFKHSEYLSTTFKKHFDISPIQYRTKLAKERK